MQATSSQRARPIAYQEREYTDVASDETDLCKNVGALRVGAFAVTLASHDGARSLLVVMPATAGVDRPGRSQWTKAQSSESTPITGSLMSEQTPDPQHSTEADIGDAQKLTTFGEPLWKDALKSMGCGLVLLALTIVGGGALAIAIIAPWGRASFDCSIYCVLRQYFGIS